jgi:hypothetical protein
MITMVNIDFFPSDIVSVLNFGRANLQKNSGLKKHHVKDNQLARNINLSDLYSGTVIMKKIPGANKLQVQSMFDTFGFSIETLPHVGSPP